jgi:nitrous oxide reductase accessory protein NosL
MDDTPTERLSRRQVLATLGLGTVALAGCGGDGGDATPARTETAAGDAVPAAYETATALGGLERNPDQLSTKDAVNYQTEPSGGQQCSNCRYYVADKNGDGLGACAIVEGTISPEAWCVSYAGLETPTGTDGTATEDGSNETETASEGMATAPQQVAVPEDAECAVCGMKAAKFPDWNGQVVHEDGTRAFFCTSGCTLTYHAVPGSFAATDAAIAGVWVTDFETGEFVDGSTAHYALETDSDRVDDPMRLNPAPFADRAAAIDYVDAVDYLTRDDVVGLPAFDRETASEYRGRFLD